MVVPVEENQGLLSEYDEHRVTQLWHFAQGEHPVPKTTHAIVQETEK